MTNEPSIEVISNDSPLFRHSFWGSEVRAFNGIVVAVAAITTVGFLFMAGAYYGSLTDVLTAEHVYLVGSFSVASSGILITRIFLAQQQQKESKSASSSGDSIE